MAYPTVDAPYGLRPVKLLSGVPYVGTVRHYSIASGYATDIFYGDAVKLVTGGTVERDTFDAAMTPIGVFMGVSYTDVLFKVAVVSSGTTIGDLAITDIGANVAGVNNSGSTVTGNSKSAISDTSATTSSLPFRIVELVEETKNSSGGFTEALVKWNAGHAFDNTTGI